jgi:hypothetical protein
MNSLVRDTDNTPSGGKPVVKLWFYSRVIVKTLASLTSLSKSKPSCVCFVVAFISCSEWMLSKKPRTLNPTHSHNPATPSLPRSSPTRAEQDIPTSFDESSGSICGSSPDVTTVGYATVEIASFLGPPGFGNHQRHATVIRGWIFHRVIIERVEQRNPKARISNPIKLYRALSA